MSILSTSSNLIKVGQDYRAGSGISIDDHVISVTGEFGKTYSAGDNVSIYEQDEHLYISSKDWEQDIANASANAYNEAVAQIPDPFDPSYLSAQIDNKLNSSDFTTWQNGQYTTDLQTIEGQINNKLDTSSFSDVSGSFLTAHQSLDGYTTEDWVTAQGYITGVDLSNYYTKDETSGKEELAQAFADIPVGDPEVNAYVTNNSATINGSVNALQTNSGVWNDVTVYQSNSANYLTAHQDISYKLDTTAFTAWSAAQAENDYQLSAGTGIDLVDDDINKITRIDVTGDFGNPEVESYVQNNSATIDDVNTSYQTNSGTFLTAHQSLEGLMSANLLEFNAENNISAYGGSAFEDCAPTLPMTGRDGVDVQLDNGSLILSSTLWETVTTNSAQWGQGGGGGDVEVNNYVYNNSAAIDETVTSYEQNSASYVVENNFEYDGNDLITAYNGSAFAGQGGGGEVPTGTMNVSGLEYNAVNEISGYNGSAIAQYGAEKQWLVHDDTLVHASNSAQYALGCNISALQRLMGIDETVLFEGNALHNHATATLSEPFTNFEKIKVYGHTDDGVMYPWYTEVPTFSGIGFIGVATNNAGWSKWFGLSVPDSTHIVPYSGYVATWASTTTGYLQNTWGITRVIGIGRKS